MGRRTELHALLADALCAANAWDASVAEDRVYFQPPASIRIQYPCILYSLSGIDAKHADDLVYVRQKKYDLTVIDKNPDSPIVDAVSLLPRCAFSRAYTADNLYHWAFSIYF